MNWVSHPLSWHNDCRVPSHSHFMIEGWWWWWSVSFFRCLTSWRQTQKLYIRIWENQPIEEKSLTLKSETHTHTFTLIRSVLLLCNIRLSEVTKRCNITAKQKLFKTESSHPDVLHIVCGVLYSAVFSECVQLVWRIQYGCGHQYSVQCWHRLYQQPQRSVCDKHQKNAQVWLSEPTVSVRR